MMKVDYPVGNLYGNILINIKWCTMIETNPFYNQAKDFTSLSCWKEPRALKLFIYQDVISVLPNRERYNLDIQIRKASCSVTANIAEGYGRFHFQEGLQFYRISRASLYELKDHLITARDLNFIDEQSFKKGLQFLEKNKISLNGFINFVKNKTPRK
jgi:four helix bundle protein